MINVFIMMKRFIIGIVFLEIVVNEFIVLEIVVFEMLILVKKR